MEPSFSSIANPSSSQYKLRQDALLRLANLDPHDLCSEAKVEKCRAKKNLRTCEQVVEHILTSCGHASLCFDCGQCYNVCPLCGVPSRQQQGNLRMRLYNECFEAGLITTNFDENCVGKKVDQCWTEDVKRLFSFFDVAMENNLISLVCHYVKDVCMDESAVSSDAVVAMLLDGAIVKDWCKRIYWNVIRHLQDIYNAGDQQMEKHSIFFGKLTVRLDAVLTVVEVLGESLSDSTAPQLIELEHLLEAASKVKQHLEVMAWCTRHKFLENVKSHHVDISHWRVEFEERKRAAVQRAWPDYFSIMSSSVSRTQATLFIEDALNYLHSGDDSNGSDNEDYGLSWLYQDKRYLYTKDGFSYPPENVHAAVDSLFLEGPSDLILAKRAIFLYYLFDCYWDAYDTTWKDIVEDYAGTFDIPRTAVLESLVFYLLDDNLEETLEEACNYLPEIVGPSTHPKVARVLLERQNPDAALMVLRCSGHDRQFMNTNGNHKHADPVSISDAVTGIRVRVECGLMTEAYLYQKNHCLQVKEQLSKTREKKPGTDGTTAYIEDRSWLKEMEILVCEMCCLCMRRKLLDRMIEIPWDSNEERFLRKTILERASQDPSSLTGNFLVVFYMQRCRYIEAYQIHKELCNLEERFVTDGADESNVKKIQDAYKGRTRLIDKCVSLMTDIERQQLRNGHYHDSFFPSLSSENVCSMDMEIEQTSASTVPECVLTSSVGQLQHAANRSLLENGLNLCSSLVGQTQTGALAASSLLFPQSESPTADVSTNQIDEQKLGFGHIQVRKLRYDDSSTPVKHTENSERSDVSSYLSFDEPDSGKSNFNLTFGSSNLKKGIEKSIRSSPGWRTPKENGHLRSQTDVDFERQETLFNDGNVDMHRSPVPTFPASNNLESSDRLRRLDQAKSNTSAHMTAVAGSNGKRLPSDRSWLSGGSHDQMTRRRGAVTGFTFGRNNPEALKEHSSKLNDQITNHMDASSSPDSSLRWRSDDAEEEEEPKSRVSGRLKNLTSSKGKAVGRSRFYTTSIP